MLPEHLTKSTRSARTALLAALVMIGTGAVYNWIVAPHRNYLLAAQRYESVVGRLDRKIHTISQDLAVKKNKLEELHEKFRQTQLELFDPVEAGQFFTNIQTESEETGCIVSLLTFSSDGPATKETPSKLDHYITKQQAVLSVAGSYGNIVTLTDKLQDNPKMVCIDSVGISADDQGAVHLECEMTITIYVIHRKE